MWFHSEVFSSRVAASIIWILLLQIFFVEIFLFLISLLSWHPFSGVEDWLSSLFSWAAVGYHFLLSSSIVIFSALHIHHYSVEPHVCLTRLQAVVNFFRPSHLIHMLSLSLAGGATVRCYLGLVGGDINNLQKSSSIEINEQHLFVILHGVYAGVIFSAKYFANSWYQLKLSSIQQMKFLTIKSRISEIFTNSFFQVVAYLRWYYVVYFIFGSYPKQWFCTILGLPISSNSSFLTFHIFDLWLLFITAGTGTIMFFTWSLYICLFNTLATERYIFMIETRIEANKEKILSKALTCIDFSLLRYLAFMDLRLLARHSPSRRLQLFAISQPGGHPYQWEAISGICLSSLQLFLSNLNEMAASTVAHITRPLNQGPLLMTPTTHISSLNTSYMPPYYSSPVTDDRALNSTFIQPGSHLSDISTSFNNYISSAFKKVRECFKKKPIVCYFLNELPDEKARKLFSTCQPVIWIIEAISFLISASYEEDRYGVVQQTLPQIICALIDLKLAEERLQLGTVFVKRHGRDSNCEHNDVLLRHSLRTAISSALYRIALTFRKNISGINVTEEYQRHLKQYLDFKE